MPDPAGLDAWLGLDRAHHGLELRLRPALARVDGGLFGGVALASAVRAMELHTQRSCLWCTVQLVRSPQAPATIALTSTTTAAGRRQAQVQVEASDADGLVFRALGTTLAPRAGDDAGPALVWRDPPRVPDPERCPERFFLHGTDQPSINTALDIRIAHGRGLDRLDATPSPDGRCCLWARIRGHDDAGSAAALAVLADHVPFACSQALGTRASAASVDNTLRLVDPRPAPWSLLDISFDAVAGGVAHGTVHAWHPDGGLLAVATQTCRVIHPDAVH